MSSRTKIKAHCEHGNIINIRYLHQWEATEQQAIEKYLQALPCDENMNTGRNSKQTTCLCRDAGGKGMLPAQHRGFNTLDNWGHKAPTQSKRKRTGKKRLKGHGPEHVYNTLGYTFITYFHASLSKYLKFIKQLRAFFAWNKSLLKWAQSVWNKAKQLTVMFLPFNFLPFVSDSKRFLWSFHTWYPWCWK